MNSVEPTGQLTEKFKPIAKAKSKTEKVKSDLEIAGAELHLTNRVLERGLSPSDKQGEVGKALDHNEVVEETVVRAAAELREVKDLLEEEIAERHLLERRLAQRPPA